MHHGFRRTGHRVPPGGWFVNRTVCYSEAVASAEVARGGNELRRQHHPAEGEYAAHR